MNKSSQEEMRKSGDYKISTGEGKYRKMHTVRGEGEGIQNHGLVTIRVRRSIYVMQGLRMTNRS